MIHQIANLARRLHAAITTGKITAVKDDGPVQMLQGDLGPAGPGGPLSLHDNLPHVQQFGHASSPPIGSDLVAVFPGGERSNGVAVGSNHPASRPRDLASGDSALYDVRGARVWLSAEGLNIDVAGLPARIHNTSELTVDASTTINGEDLVVNGRATVNGDAHVNGDATVSGSLTCSSLAG